MLRPLLAATILCLAAPAAAETLAVTAADPPLRRVLAEWEVRKRLTGVN